MPDRTQDLKNLRAVFTASVNYTNEVRDNLQWQLGTYDLSVDTVNGTTMLLPTPANTIQATMVRIDGASEVSENLIVLSDVAETTINGITYKIENGILYLKGTATANTTILFNSIDLANGTYYFSIGNNDTLTNMYFVGLPNGTWVDVVAVYQSSTRTLSGNYRLGFAISNGKVIGDDYYQLKPMLVSGSTAPSEFKVGYTGIHNLELSGLKVEGANKKDLNYPTMRYYRNNMSDFTNVSDASTNRIRTESFEFNYVLNKAYYINNIPNGISLIAVRCYDSTQEFINNSSTVSGNSFTITNSNIKYIHILFGGSDFNDNTRTLFNQIGIFESNIYVDFVQPTTLPIDLSTILYNGSPLFEGNSLKAVNDVKDILTPYKATKKLGRITISQWTYNPSTGFIRSTVINDAKAGNDDQTSNILSDKYETKSYNDMKDNHLIGIAMGDNKQVYIYTGEDISPTVDIEYELDTSIEVSIDFSQLVKFEAHSNGSITLVNTNNQDTTSTFKYLKEVAK